LRDLANKMLAPVLKTLGIERKVVQYVAEAKNKKREKSFADQLEPKIVSENYDVVTHPLFCCARNEMHRIPFFLEYYRNMGVDHFFFIDNNSTDNFIEYMKQQPDCSVWFTKYSYKESNFGMAWCNYLLKTYGTGKWCLTVDPDEFFVYPKMESRNLIELTEHLDSIEQPSVLSLMIDAYSDKPVSETYLNADDSPFDICPYFDRFNYRQEMNWELENVWLQGGVRMRKFFNQKPEKAPAQNKIPLIKWKSEYKYLSSMHHTNTNAINCTIKNDNRFLSAALFHYKYVSALQEKVAEEMTRKQHYESGAEYKKYKEQGFETLYDEDWAVKYENSEQLLTLQMMHIGEWF